MTARSKGDAMAEKPTAAIDYRFIGEFFDEATTPAGEVAGKSEPAKMHEPLALLIKCFRTAQDLAVKTLVQKLKIPQPASKYDWLSICREHAKTCSKLGIRPHGVGVELKIDSLTSDFDWGDNGEPDGFDGWRLYNFALYNLPTVKCTHSEVNSWLDAAWSSGEIVKQGDLYYYPRNRAGIRSTSELEQSPID